MSRIPIAIQLYSIREDFAGDTQGTIEKVAEMGYEGVEFAGYNDYSAADLRRMLDDNGLKTAGTHMGIDSLLGNELDRTVEFNKALDNKFLIVPGLPKEYTDSIDSWRRTADVFNEIADRLEPFGMFTGYHNHMHEFAPVDGQVPFEVLFDNTSDAVVMQADTGNALEGNSDIIPYIKKYAGRARTVHLKEFSSDNREVLLGEGEMDWQECFDVCESAGGTQWYIVEQEQYAYPPMECVERCLKALKDMGK